MSSRTDKDKAKQLQDKCQSVLNTLLRDEDNKYCVDCDSKGKYACLSTYPVLSCLLIPASVILIPIFLEQFCSLSFLC